MESRNVVEPPRLDCVRVSSLSNVVFFCFFFLIHIIFLSSPFLPSRVSLFSARTVTSTPMCCSLRASAVLILNAVGALHTSLLVDFSLSSQFDNLFFSSSRTRQATHNSPLLSHILPPRRVLSTKRKNFGVDCVCALIVQLWEREEAHRATSSRQYTSFE